MMKPLLPEIRKGFVLAVSAPSGTGKTSLCDKLAVDFPFVTRSISVTTRPKRDGEISGRDYEFVDLEEFKRRESSQELLETADVFGFRYGTPRKPVEAAMADGKVIVMDIDTKGAFEVKRILKEDCVTLFVLPPSLDELERRLRLRGKNTAEELERRLKEASREISESVKYEYIIANETFELAYQHLSSVLFAERSRGFRLKLKTP